MTIALEQRFEQTPDGATWLRVGYPYAFWRRYLEVFSGVTVVARVKRVTRVGDGYSRVDGEEVTVHPVPDFHGPREYLQRYLTVNRAVRSALDERSAVIFRAPSLIAQCLEPAVRGIGQPYGMEIVGDPYAVFAPGVVHHPLRPFLRYWFTARLKRQCEGACAIAYVTESALQERYPAPGGAFTTHYSSIDIQRDAFVDRPPPAREACGEFTAVTVASLMQLYKATDVLLEAQAASVRSGVPVRLVIVGDGVYRTQLEEQARVLGLARHVVFTGELPNGEAVRSQLDRADLFVLPSRTEGLPRAMIEAMARGLPCIGSDVGGIPELLPSDDLVPADDVRALADKIRTVVLDPERRAQMAQRNLEKAREYQESALAERRRAFYQAVRERTERWLTGAERSVA